MFLFMFQTISQGVLPCIINWISKGQRKLSLQAKKLYVYPPDFYNKLFVFGLTMPNMSLHHIEAGIATPVQSFIHINELL